MSMRKTRSGQWMFGGAVIIFVFGLFILAYVFTLQGGNTVQQTYQTVSSFAESVLDVTANNIRASLLRPAALFGAFSTAAELAARGGYSQDAVTKIKNINGVALWTAVTDVEKEEVKEQIPFLYWRDEAKTIGPEAVEIEVPIRVSTFSKLTLAPLQEGLVEVFFLKPGSVSIECTVADCTPNKITSDGFHKIDIKVAPVLVATLFKMKITASGEGVAMIRQVVLATQKGGADMANAALSKKIDAWVANFKQTEFGKAADFPPAAASFAESKEGFMNVTTFVPDKFVAKAGEKQAVNLISRGYVDEALAIRYWKLYDIAKKIAEKWEEDSLATALRDHVKQTIADVVDKITDKQETCGACTPRSCAEILQLWGGRAYHLYNNDALKTVIETAIKESPQLSSMKTFWSQFETDGIKIEEQVTARPLEDKDNKKPWGENLWKEKSRNVDVNNQDTGIACSCTSIPPPPRDPQLKCGKDESYFSGCSGSKITQTYRLCQVTCEYDFGANYDTKITVTDSTYQIFTSAGWTKLKFTFDLEWLFKDQEIEKPFTDTCTPSPTCSSGSPSSGYCISTSAKLPTCPSYQAISPVSCTP